MNTSELRKSAKAHLEGNPPPRRVVMQQLQCAADEIDRLRKEDKLRERHARAAFNSIWPQERK